MMKQLCCVMILLSSALFTKAVAQEHSSLFPKGELATNTENFTGKIWLTFLSHADSTFNFNLDVATYAPDSKLDWHIHPGGQILIITEGIGFYQERDKPVQVVRKGDVVKCAPGVEHWHAATPNTSFAYLSISPAGEGKTIWLENVSEEKYHSIPLPVVNKNEK